MHRTWLVLVGVLALALGMFVSQQVYRSSQFKAASPQAVDVVVAANPDNSRKLNTKSLFHGKKPLSTRLWYQEEAFV